MVSHTNTYTHVVMLKREGQHTGKTASLQQTVRGKTTSAVARREFVEEFVAVLQQIHGYELNFKYFLIELL